MTYGIEVVKMFSIEEEKLARDKLAKIKEILRRKLIIVNALAKFDYNPKNQYYLEYKPFGNGTSELIYDVYAEDIAGCRLYSKETFKYDEINNCITYDPKSKYNVGMICVRYNHIMIPDEEILDVLLN